MEQYITIPLGYSIYCKVTGISDKPYVLLIPGGPGFGYLAVEPTGNLLGKEYNLILFDPLSCGKSSRALIPTQEYNIDTYAEIAAQVIETIKTLLNIESMNLRILGQSFGSMIAMYIPIIRPDWVLLSADIKLTQIISVAGPISYNSINQAIDYVRENYDDPVLTNHVERLMNGTITGQQDYLDNVVFRMAPIYSDKMKELFSTRKGKFLNANHNRAVKLLSLGAKLSSRYYYMYNTLTGCSLDVLNTFFRNKFGNLDLEQIIKDNFSLYRSISILSISGSRDHIANPLHNSDVLSRLLPDTLFNIVFDSKHSIATDYPEELGMVIREFLNDTLSSDHLDALIQKKIVVRYN